MTGVNLISCMRFMGWIGTGLSMAFAFLAKLRKEKCVNIKLGIRRPAINWDYNKRAEGLLVIPWSTTLVFLCQSIIYSGSGNIWEWTKFWDMTELKVKRKPSGKQ